MTVKGRVWMFGDDINTDLIIPGRYLDNYDPAHLAAHAMEGASKDFASKASKGDIIVAGKNFGCGSSREQAVIALKHAGVSAIVAKSFARIFYRNAINLGLPVVESEDAHEVFSEGAVAVLDMDSSRLESEDGTRFARLKEIPVHARRILDQGGLIPHIRARLKERGK
jgi:3-isopropylmalate/(R)-2-methylmalate dehydratase small subunit